MKPSKHASGFFLLEFPEPLSEADRALWLGLWRSIPPGGAFFTPSKIAVAERYADELRALGCELPGQAEMAL